LAAPAPHPQVATEPACGTGADLPARGVSTAAAPAAVPLRRQRPIEAFTRRASTRGSPGTPAKPRRTAAPLRGAGGPRSAYRPNPTRGRVCRAELRRGTAQARIVGRVAGGVPADLADVGDGDAPAARSVRPSCPAAHRRLQQPGRHGRGDPHPLARPADP